MVYGIMSGATEMLLGLLCVIERMYKYKCSRVWMMEDDEGGYKNMQLIN